VDIHNIPGSIHEASISAMCLRRLKYDYVAFVMYSLLLLYIEFTEIPILFTLLFRVVRSTHASKSVAIPVPFSMLSPTACSLASRPALT
jgi:hypothetical protein